MAAAPDTIVLIHGLWMTPLAWEHRVTRYEERGFRVLTPGYPGIGQGEAGLLALRGKDLGGPARLAVLPGAAAEHGLSGVTRLRMTRAQPARVVYPAGSRAGQEASADGTAS
jgi:hypothetical protein